MATEVAQKEPGLQKPPGSTVCQSKPLNMSFVSTTPKNDPGASVVWTTSPSTVPNVNSASIGVCESLEIDRKTTTEDVRGNQVEPDRRDLLRH